MTELDEDSAAAPRGAALHEAAAEAFPHADLQTSVEQLHSLVTEVLRRRSERRKTRLASLAAQGLPADESGGGGGGDALDRLLQNTLDQLGMHREWIKTTAWDLQQGGKAAKPRGGAKAARDAADDDDDFGADDYDDYNPGASRDDEEGDALGDFLRHDGDDGGMMRTTTMMAGARPVRRGRGKKATRADQDELDMEDDMADGFSRGLSMIPKPKPKPKPQPKRAKAATQVRRDRTPRHPPRPMVPPPLPGASPATATAERRGADRRRTSRTTRPRTRA